MELKKRAFPLKGGSSFFSPQAPAQEVKQSSVEAAVEGAGARARHS